MNSRLTISSVFLFSSLALASASFAHQAPSAVPVLVQTTLSGQGFAHTQASPRAAANLAATVDVPALTRSVLSGVGAPSSHAGAALQAVPAEGAGEGLLRADALQIVRRTLSGQAG